MAYRNISPRNHNYVKAFEEYLQDGTSMLCCSNVVQVPLSLNPFQLNLEFGTTHRVALCVVHPRYTKSN